MLCPACGTENIDGTDRCDNCLTPFRDLDIPRSESAEGLARSVMEDKLNKLGYDDPVCATPNTPAFDVVQRMKENHSGCALVIESGKLVGIFTEHDVLLKMTNQSSSPPTFEVVEEVVLVAEETAALPVESLPVNDLPFSEIPVEELRAEESSFREPGVMEAESVVVQTGVDEATLLVKDLMTANPETLHEHETVAFALNKMSLGRYRHLPVQKDDGTYTVASIKNVLNYIARDDW
jgi:CBS domain-containing protein